MVKLASPTDWRVHPSARELEGYRTKDSKTFVLPDGQRVAVIGRDYHHGQVPDEQGISYWEDVDLTWQGGKVTKNRIRAAILADGIEVSDPESGASFQWVTPRQPQDDGRKARYSDQGLEWSYAVTNRGLKLTAPIPSPMGKVSFALKYRASKLPTFTPNGQGLQAGILAVPAPYFIGKSGLLYPCGSLLALPFNRIRMDYDDTGIPPSEFPGTLDPSTTFTVAASADDGRATATGATYPPTGSPTVNTTAQTVILERSTSYTVTVGLVRWDTSTIPSGASVTSAILRLATNTAPVDGDGRSFVAEWYLSSNWPIDSTDWTSTSSNNAHAGTLLSAISSTVGATTDFNLTNLSNINLVGYTGLRLHIDGGAPTLNNSWSFATFDHTTSPKPQLILTYTVQSGYHMII